MAKQQSDSRPIKFRFIPLFAVALIVYGSARCTTPSVATPTDILGPSPTAALKPADTLAAPTTVPVTSAARLEVETETAVMPETLDIPLGIGIFDSDNVDFFNRYAREDDVISARPPYMNLLNDVEIGQKMLNFNPRDEPVTDAGSIISKAKAMGVVILGYNLEMALSREELISKEIEVQSLASENDLLYAFGPTILKLLKYYDDLARHADVLVLQSQRFQTTEDYEERVEGLIGSIKSVRPGVQVWVVVSVNPPEKYNATPDEVISDIQLIADTADLVWINFNPKAAPAMEEVFKRLRE